MKHLKRFNEEFDFNKLNPFSKKGPAEDKADDKNIENIDLSSTPLLFWFEAAKSRSKMEDEPGQAVNNKKVPIVGKLEFEKQGDGSYNGNIEFHHFRVVTQGARGKFVYSANVDPFRLVVKITSKGFEVDFNHRNSTFIKQLPDLELQYDNSDARGRNTSDTLTGLKFLGIVDDKTDKILKETLQKITGKSLPSGFKVDPNIEYIHYDAELYPGQKGTPGSIPFDNYQL